MSGAESPSPQSLRIDKWLWHARFFKTRSLAAKQVSEGKIRVNATKISKPARTIGPGDVLTFPQANAIRVVRVVALGERRGPAPEAQALYEDLSPPEDQPRQAPLARVGARPTKKERRRLINSRSEPLD
ncbi:RNA-binding S4 domain-containing protein [Tropicimonas sp. TH_r6]|uniref:RNA-binding S4 domain-containing protein n=1 Tax=Tropicimonas sp. TH_r6 TaxID=3082085 RepID=UPI00295585FF|nr:RNA-binding S4 domain-containing protein [Tropicimonas sp. TH_r6]MDV7142790.1 RNA-binding S4 domain-containing protein [Tropicimonas sp. TH_r6]